MSKVDELRALREARFTRTETVASPATKPVAATASVACPECARLRLEVARLTLALQEGKPKPMTATERSRRLRAKRKP